MINCILVGTDGSPTAQRATTRAAELAATVGARLLIVKAYTEREPRSSAEAYEPTLAETGATSALPGDVGRPVGARAETLADLEAAVAEARGLGVEDVTPIARAGEAADTILDLAEEEGVDLIVVGNKGMSGAARFLLGSVPNRITHHAPCDVLVVRTT